jgi:hypothetical protein
MDLVPYIKRLDAKTVEFRALPGKIRTAIVGYLKCEGKLTEDLSALLRVPVSTIYYHWARYKKQLAADLQRNASHHIGRTVARAEHLYKAAKKAGNFELCWKIEKDLLDVLMKMGLVESTPAQVDLTVRRGGDVKSPEEIEAELGDDLDLLRRGTLPAEFKVKDADGNGQPPNGAGAGAQPGVPPEAEQGGDDGEGGGEGESA